MPLSVEGGAGTHTFVYFANRVGVRPGNADVTLAVGTLILKSSADGVNKREKEWRREGEPLET